MCSTRPVSVHPRLEQRRQDLAEAVVPLVRHGLRELDVGLDVRPGLVPDERLGGLEVRVLDREPVRPIVERPQHRVGLAHEEASAGPEQARHDIAPALDVGQPAERADPREDEVEAALPEDVGGGVDVGFHECDVGARLLREPTGLGERGGGEVEPGHPRAEPREGDRVRPDVTLEVDAFEAGDVAEERQVVADDVAQVLLVRAESGEGVAARRCVRGRALVPVGAVDSPVVLAHAVMRSRT